MGVNRSLTSVKFGRVSKLVKSGGFFRYKVDISGNLRLIDFSGFPRFQFEVRVMHYRIFLLIIRGGK